SAVAEAAAGDHDRSARAGWSVGSADQARGCRPLANAPVGVERRPAARLDLALLLRLLRAHRRCGAEHGWHGWAWHGAVARDGYGRSRADRCGAAGHAGAGGCVAV